MCHSEQSLNKDNSSHQGHITINVPEMNQQLKLRQSRHPLAPFVFHSGYKPIVKKLREPYIENEYLVH